MNNNDYSNYIEKLIPSIFKDIYTIDMMADVVTEYTYEDDCFSIKSTFPFTTFFTSLENIIHPEDIKGYIDSITPNNIEINLDENKKNIRYQYRKKDENGEYKWFTNIVQLIEINQKKIPLVIVEDINENVMLNKSNSQNIEDLEKKQKIIFDTVSNAIINLNNVININYGSDNQEIRSMSQYVNNILIDLTNTLPELNEALTANMIANTNQGKNKTILVVDDDQMTCKLLAKTFEDTYKIVIANNGQEAINILEKNSDRTNLEEKDKIVGMFLDLNMPIVDGFGVLDYMSSKNLLSKMPVIIISGDYEQTTKDRAYLYPIADVLEKPFSVQVVKHRIKTLVKLYKSNTSLNEIVLNQHQELKNILSTYVKSYLYDYSYDIKKVSSYVNILARQLSEEYHDYNFDQDKLIKLTEAAKYYRIGLHILPHKMFKKQNFNNDEIRIIKSHPFIGLSIFNSVLYRNMDGTFNHFAKDIIKNCQEKYDGSGYPHGIKGDDIPKVAQIAAVAIEYNELMKVMNESSVLEEIKKGSGTKFNPKIIESLEKCIDKIRKVNEAE